MVRSSPRARAGLSRFAASPCPAWPPAPMSVWASSMNRMIGRGDDLTSSMTDFSRFSNSPFTPAPACSSPRSSVRSVTAFSGSGTSPAAIRSAKPSTTAVLPTPASPVRMGLFCRRRVRMSMARRISASRPTTGSILPATARSVRLTVNWSRLGVFDGGPAGAPATPGVPPTAGPASGLSNSSPPRPPRTSRSSLASCSPGTRTRVSELPLTPSLSFESVSNAASRCPPRIAPTAHSIDATTHASRSRSSTLIDSAGARPLPVLKRASAPSSSRFTDGTSAP